MTRTRNRSGTVRKHVLVLAAAGCLSLPGLASAASSAWTGTDAASGGSDNWSDTGNWASGVPGSTSSTTDADVATFPSVTLPSGDTSEPVTLDASYNIGGIAFTGGSYTINEPTVGGPTSLELTSGSAVTNITSGTGATQTFNVPIVVELSGAAGTATINSGSVTSDVMNLAGNLSGAATSSAATTTITLNGGKTGTVSGVISDNNTGGAANVTNIVLGGNSGTWTLSGANTYTGTTTLTSSSTGDTLNVSSISSTGTEVTGPSNTQSADGFAVTSSSLGSPTTVANGTIGITANLTLNFTGSTATTTDRVIALLAHVTGGQGGQITENGSGALTFVSNMTSTGAVAKTLTLAGGGSGGGTFQGIISDDTSTSTTYQTTVTKGGAGNWTLSGANTFTGPVNINQGQLIMGGNDTLGSTIALSNLAVKSGNNMQVTYTAANGNTPVVGSTVVAPGLAPDTYVTAATATTLTLSSSAAGLSGTTGTDSSPIQMAGTNGPTLNLNGYTLDNRRIYMQTGANINNTSTTTAVITTDISDQSGGGSVGTDQYGVGGGTGNIQIAGINGGTMNHKGTGTLTITPNAGTTNVITMLATAGVIQMGEANALTSTSNLTLNGGTYSTGGFNQGLTNLTVNSGNGTIDFGAGNTGSVLNFASLASFAGTSLTINNWIGTAGQGGGTDQFLFASNANFTSAVLADIDFTGYAPGSELVSNGSEYEVVPVSVPEPASLTLIGLSMTAFGIRRRRAGR